MKRREMNEKKQHAIDIEDPYKRREWLSTDDVIRISLLGVTYLRSGAAGKPNVKQHP